MMENNQKIEQQNELVKEIDLKKGEKRKLSLFIH